METKDPALNKTPITDRETGATDNITTEPVAHKEQKLPLASNHSEDFHSSDDEIEAKTTVNKGTDTFKKDVLQSEHVNDGDNLARQPDRRDQQGSAFDDGINEHNVGSKNPKSEELTTLNRYANTDNAQTRVLSADEKD